MSKLLICEKQSCAVEYLKHLNKEDSILLCPAVVSYMFNYDRELYFKDLPFYQETSKYKENITNYQNEYEESWFLKQHSSEYNLDNNTGFKNELIYNFFIQKKQNQNSKECKKLEKLIHQYFASFDEIVFACDLDHTGVRGFDFLFKYFYNIPNLKAFCHNNNIKLKSYEFKTIHNLTINEPNKYIKNFNTSEKINNLRIAYINKDFFEYNYNLNSLMLFNKIYFNIFKEYPEHILTKNFISTLFLFEHLEYIDINKILTSMRKKEIGHPASQNLIIEKMTQLRLIEKNNNSNSYKITKEGRVMLSFLHRKVNDPHLTNRVYVDHHKLSISDFKIKYSNYLSTVFSKQKRFLNKML